MSKSRWAITLCIMVLFAGIVLIWGTWFTIDTTSTPSVLPTLAELSDVQPEPVKALSTIENMVEVIDDVTPPSIVVSDIVESDIQPIDVPQEPALDQYIIELTDEQTVDEFSAYLESLNIEVVDTLTELNRVIVIADTTVIEQLSAEPVVSTEPDYYASALLTLPPSDPFYEYQWNLTMIGAPSAWTGLPPVIAPIRVAVIDSGMCFNHPDMQGIYTDFQWDYVDQDVLPNDMFGHGCSVTGVIASQNNTMGGIGVAPFVEIMPLRVLDENGIGTYSNIAQAIVDATQHGAQIINLSLGGNNQSSTLQSAIDYALANDVYIVAATGNTGQSTPLYPAAYDGVIAVGSVNSDGIISSFSNRGENSLAPGEAILAPYVNDSYTYLSGTSLAAPHVSGVIALDLALGRDPVINDGIIQVRAVSVPTEEATPDATETPEFITRLGRTIPYFEQPATTKTDRWAVKLQRNVDADTLATQLGFRNIGQVGELDDYYVFIQEGTGASEALALSAVQALSTSPQILEFEQEVILDRELRAIPTDPLVDEQWHLINNGQSSGTVGYDINVEDAWNSGVDGTGITIAIVDDGMDITHPDFVSKYDPSASYDFNGTDTNSLLDEDNNPSHETVMDRHGTSVAGVAAADDDGAQCGVGVAYNANLSALRLIGYGHGRADSQEAAAFNYAMQTNDIYNNSWGPPDVGYLLEGPGSLANAALQNGVINGRGGKGVVYVWAGGNGDGYPYYDHSNADGYANSRYTIAVGATDDTGEKAFYSEIGTNLLVTAPAGPTSTLDTTNEPVGIVTTDRLGDLGYNNSMGFSNNCTDSFGGTSSATPTVAGVVALMLDANPNLTWRDVQHILVESSSKNDPTDESWNTNAAGYEYNMKYGFGTVDATAAVNLAQTWTSVGTEVTASQFGPFDNDEIADGLADWEATDIPEFGEPTYTSFYFPENIKIESVIARVHINHPWRGDVMLKLTSPYGTTSYIYPTRKGDGIDFDGIMEPMSLEFWGEMSAGVWTLEAADGWELGVGEIYGVTLKIAGTQGPPPEDGWRVGDIEGFRYAAYEFETNDQADTIILNNGLEYIFSDTMFGSSDEYALPSLSEELTIVGNGGIIKRSNNVGVDNFKLMRIFSTGKLTLNNVVIDNFHANVPGPGHSEYGGIFVNAGTLVINDSTIDRGYSDTEGGAIYNTGELIIDNSYIRGSAAQGGGIYQADGTVDITNSILRGNATGGGIYVDGGIVNITDSEFQYGSGQGGGIYLADGDTTLTGVRFYRNSGSSGGAIAYRNLGTATVSMNDVVFEENTATNYGGAIYFATAPADYVYIDNATFIDNQQNSTQTTDYKGGGAVAILGGGGATRDIWFTNSTFTNNSATNDGGAIFSTAVGRVRLDNVSFIENSAEQLGGAITMGNAKIVGTNVIFEDNIGRLAGGAISLQEAQPGLLLLDKVLMTGNSSPEGFGGAIHMDGSQSVYLVNATISDNSSALHGGAIYFSQLNHLYISHSTITNNTADTGNTDLYGGGGIWNIYPSQATHYHVYLHNSILYDNIDTSSTTDYSPDCYGWVRETGLNIVSDVAGCSFVGVGSYITDDPLLSPLQDNGGFAKTHAIPITSPAYDAAADCTKISSDDLIPKPLTDDMRSIARPKGATCDIGAFELTTGYPDDPTSLNVIGTSYTQAQLTWTDNATDETAYLIERASVGGSDWVQIAQVSENTVSYIDMPLSCDSSFDYRVRAYRFGDYQYSQNYTNVATGGPWLCQPDQPTNVTVSTVLYQEALDVNWQDTNDDESEFRIFRSNSISGTFNQEGTAGTDATSFNDTAVSECYTEYFYQVQVYRAIDGQSSPLSDIASGTTSCATVTPPNSLVADGIEDVMDLTWSDNSPDETSFEIQRSISGANNWSAVGTVSANVTVYTDVITACGSEYDYRVRAYRAGDTNYSTFSETSSATQFCPPPPAPSVLSLIALPFSNDIQLDWVDNSNSETDFYIQRSTDGSTDWGQIATVSENVTTYTDTDASLDCYTPYHYRVQAYRSDDGVSSTFSNSISIQTWCDPALLTNVLNSITENETTVDISGVLGFPQSSCASNINHAFVWEFPATDSQLFSLTTFGSSIDTVLSIWNFDGTSFYEIACNDDSALDGTSALTATFPNGSQYMVIVGSKNNISGDIQLNSSVIIPPTATPVPTHTDVPTPTETPNLTTVGVFKDGIWQFRDSNTTGSANISIRFGSTIGSDAIPLVGDWNGDGTDGIGLYKNGRWFLRDVVETGSSADYVFRFGVNQSDWQPVVGDWDGDGVDGIGLYKNGTWMLKNTPSSGDADYSFRFNPSRNSDAIAISGDWHDEAIDRVGLYDNGTWFLSNDHRTSNDARIFQFGPTDGLWLPIAGDWDEDGDDTIGVYKDGGWRLRNTNSRGNPDLGLSFGLSDAMPIAGYRGDAGSLALFASISDYDTIPTLPSDAPVQTLTATEQPTIESVEVTEEPSVETTSTPTSTQIPTSTGTPTYTATVPPTLTPSSTWTLIPTFTPTPIHTATNEPPQIPDNVSGS